MHNAIIFDTETTSKNDPIIIEAAWLELASLTPFTLSNAHCQRYNPGQPITLGSLAVHHILDEELTDCPPSASFKLPSEVQYLIGHNIDFDWKAIGSPDIRRICTLALSRRAWPELDSHSQGALIYYIDRLHARDRLKNAHSAAADVALCADILRRLCEHFDISELEQLWAASEQARIPTHMTFGKHKGLAIEDVPKDYRRWLLGQADVDAYLRIALEK